MRRLVRVLVLYFVTAIPFAFLVQPAGVVWDFAFAVYGLACTAAVLWWEGTA